MCVFVYVCMCMCVSVCVYVCVFLIICKQNHVMFLSCAGSNGSRFNEFKEHFLSLFFGLFWSYDFLGSFLSIVQRSTTLNRGVPYLYRISTGMNRMSAGVNRKSTALNRAQPGSNVSLPG